ncbi:MAG: hypothetical protein AAF802_03005 [Planctomycetota bacterium]
MRRKSKFSYEFYRAMKDPQINFMDFTLSNAKEYRDAAWTIYKNVHRQGLPFMLLGDTKIRQQKELLQNFGVLSRNDEVQEAEEQEKINGVERFRRQRNLRLARHEFPMPTMTGSILSTQNWSPVLNDSMMIAGAECSKMFHLTLEPFETTQFELVKRQWMKKVQEEKQTAHRRGIKAEDPTNPPDYKPDLAKTIYWQRQMRSDLWKKFFQRHIKMLWDVKGGFPRVLAREILGLKAFGYRPDFHFHQLIFEREDQGCTVGFTEYHDELRSSGYTDTNRIRGRTKMLKVLGKYLFEDEGALLQNHRLKLDQWQRNLRNLLATVGGNPE